ncbi:hypothetical protein DNTS_009655 [Danionella cerebrum]|uniref:RING-type domain-containing protein n=1 Tax=Danionella cerebrum TaxID=2873325 RepID=A0A553N4D0_9TELE|nr:hypothetical protein DNTS_009655 [Danionella translucida]
MNSAWTQKVKGQGRGRGRGRGHAGATPDLPSPGATMGSENKASSERRFAEIRSSDREIAQRLSTHTLSSDEDDDDDDDDEDGGKKMKVLRSALSPYTTHTGSSVVDLLDQSAHFLKEVCESGGVTCLICISTVRRTQPVWSCVCCFCMLHLSCIQKWARDSALLLSLTTEDSVKDPPWPCPKCRFEYSASQTPQRYLCYCGKEVEPEPNPWLLPHSCGQVCERALGDTCTHTCLLLCHPGPCPPCPQMVSVSCACGKSPAVPRRCSSSLWSCRSPCGRTLRCGTHSCTHTCHPGECEPCPRVSVQKCVCGRKREERPCASPEWHCEQVCGRTLSCGNHSCERVCHAGACGECPRAGNRCCPCGKTRIVLPCTQDVPTCGDTCGKRLECGRLIHTCSMRCHHGPCETCRQEVEKTCRCGRYTRLLACHKEDYTCDTKCSKLRSCSRHHCKRKCCAGTCPPCDQICNRMLGCRNHRCPAACHPGSCYPCPEQVSVSCHCGSTVVTVPCGRERSTRPPRCKQICRKPPPCPDHNPLQHRCHVGPCPPCMQICARPLPGCNHTCPASCHRESIVMPSNPQVVLSGPWEQRSAPVAVKMSLPCPPCALPVPRSCLGQHEMFDRPCHTLSLPSVSCGRVCGRTLSCGNHSCSLECHHVSSSPGSDSSQAGPECVSCDQGCSHPRPDGCSHPCALPCHSGKCPPCGQTLRKRCHCRIISLYIQCVKFTTADDEGKQLLMSCQNQCPKQLVCGHRCKLLCHAGECERSCSQRVKIRCPCKRIRKDVPCVRVQAQECVLMCDETCRELQKKQAEALAAEERAALDQEMKQQQLELELFQNRLKGRRKKRRVTSDVDSDEPSLWSRLKILLPLCGVLLAVAVFFLLRSTNEETDRE